MKSNNDYQEKKIVTLGEFGRTVEEITGKRVGDDLKSTAEMCAHAGNEQKINETGIERLEQHSLDADRTFLLCCFTFLAACSKMKALHVVFVAFVHASFS